MPTPHSMTLVASRTWRANQSPFTSPAADWPAGATEATLVIQTADFTQPTQTATFSVDRSLDGGATWDLVAVATFVGGLDRRGNPITPGISFSPGSDELAVPFQVRARLEMAGPSFSGPAVLTWTTEP